MTDDQELTRDEAIALADDLGNQLYRAEDRIEFVREMLVGRTEPVAPVTVLAWLDHQHCPCVESEQQQIKRLTAELEENTGVIKALRRQRDQAEAAVERIRSWAAATEHGHAAAEATLPLDQLARTTPNNPLTSTNTVDNPEEPK